MTTDLYKFANLNATFKLLWHCKAEKLIPKSFAYRINGLLLVNKRNLYMSSTEFMYETLHKYCLLSGMTDLMHREN